MQWNKEKKKKKQLPNIAMTRKNLILCKSPLITHSYSDPRSPRTRLASPNNSVLMKKKRRH